MIERSNCSITSNTVADPLLQKAAKLTHLLSLVNLLSQCLISFSGGLLKAKVVQACILIPFPLEPSTNLSSTMCTLKENVSTRCPEHGILAIMKQRLIKNLLEYYVTVT